YELLTPDGRADDEFGGAVAGVADLDGDGVNDLLVGAPGHRIISCSRCGRAYAYSGASGLLLYEFASPNEERDGFFGFSVAGIPDLDGDGVGDLAIGAPGDSPDPSPGGAG